MEKGNDKFTWKEGDLTVAKKVWKGKVVKNFPWEETEKKPEPKKKKEK